MGAKNAFSRVIPAIAAVAAAVAVALPAFGQDPCSQTTKLTGGTVVDLGGGNQKTGNISGTDYHYEIWVNSRPASAKLTIFGAGKGGGGAFKAEWNNNDDYLGRVGYSWGNNGAKWNTYTNLCADFNYTRSGNGTGGNYSYIGIYGWTLNPVMEWYIIDDWFGSGQLGPATVCGNNCSSLGTVEADGGTYDVFTNTRPAGSGCVGCNGQAFPQIFSIRRNMGSNRRQCGTYSITKHFEAWSKISSLSSKIGNNLYEAKFLAEAGNGTGWLEMTYLSMSKTGACGISIPAGNFTLTVAASPSTGGTVTRSPSNDSYTPNASVKVIAKAASGWKLDGWDGATGTTDTVTVVMNANKTVTARFVPVANTTTNLVKDGNFPGTSLTSNWILNQGDGYGNSAASASVSSNKVTINVTTKGANVWEPQLVQNGITLVKGVKYVVSFDAYAASARTIGVIIQMAGDPYTDYFGKDVSLTNANQTFTYEFEMKEESDEDGRLGFNFGQATGSVTISNVSVKYASTTSVSDNRRAAASPAKPTLRATPISSGVKVSFKSSESGTATLRLYSLKGDVLSSVNLQTVSGKSYTHTLSPAGGKLPSGFYMVGLQRGGGAVERMAVLVQ